MTYTNSAYELIFQNEMPLPELPLYTSGNGSNGGYHLESVVNIRLGSVPQALENPIGKGVLYQASANQFLLKMDNVARYLVQNGNEIIVDPAPNALESDIRVFLLGSALGALLHQREMLVLHASAIRTKAGAVLFAGASGSGKSTLLGEMLNRGYPMMVDDVCAVVQDDNGIPIVLPGYPRTRIWADSAKVLDVETENLARTRPTLEKYERQIPKRFWEQSAPLRHIYHLTTNQDELRLKPLPRIHNFCTVLHNTYRHAFLDGLAMRQSHFKQASAVATNVGVTRVSRPIGVFNLKELADLIEEDLSVNGER